MIHIDTQHSPTIFVLGDLMLDHYIIGKTSRISPEAPVPVVSVSDETYTLGGALNVVNNLVSLGAKVYAGGVVGNDKAGKNILEQLGALNVNIEAIYTEDDRITTQKSRIMANGQQIMRYDKERKQPLSTESQNSIIHFFLKYIEQFDAVLLSDYNKGTLTDDLCKEIITIANQHQKKVLVDPKGTNYSKYRNAYLITPNKNETHDVTGIDLINEQALLTAGKQLKADLHLQKVVMTLGNQGMALYDETLIHFPTVAQEVYDVTGAGDTVLAALGYALSMDMVIGEACQFANAAAAVVVGKVGCATADHAEITSFLHKNGVNELFNKSKSLVEIKTLVNELRAENKKIVFTNGCFDILHSGHVTYLQKAKALGDVLIVGLNSDDSVRGLKGEGRPINTVNDRELVLAGLSSVNYIVVFNDETPYDLIKTIEPDVLVKGADYTDKKIVGSDIAKKVVLIDFIEGKSTTSVLNMINKA